MRYAVISDVHSNEPALRAVLADAERVGIDGILCLGDVVGYGADPLPVIGLLTTAGARCVAGNHDRATVGLADLQWFNPYARRAAEWTAERLGDEETRYLTGLALVEEHQGAMLVHASPHRPERWTYLVSAGDGRAALAATTAALCFVGHSHVPACWVLRPDGVVDFRRGVYRTRTEPGHRYLLNVGSVGQPRDGDPDAAYAVWDLDAGEVAIRRVRYDVVEARRRIHAAGLPELLGDRLLRGR